MSTEKKPASQGERINMLDFKVPTLYSFMTKVTEQINEAIWSVKLVQENKFPRDQL